MALRFTLWLGALLLLGVVFWGYHIPGSNAMFADLGLCVSSAASRSSREPPTIAESVMAEAGRLVGF